MSERVLGVGVDIIEADRVGELIERYGFHFLGKALTPRELEGMGGPASRPMYAARRIAAKEAVMKALGTGLRPGTSWQDIEVDDRGAGRCSARLLSSAGQGRKLHLAISRHGGRVVAMATLVSTEEHQ